MNEPPKKDPRSIPRFEPYVPITKSADNQQYTVDPKRVVDYYWTTPRYASSERLLGEILPDDSIVDAPSLVTPLLLKKRSIWPAKIIDEPVQPSEQKNTNDTEKPSNDNVEININSEKRDSDKGQGPNDDIQIVRVVDPNSSEPATASRYLPIEEYIKSTVVVSLTNNSIFSSNKNTLAISDYYKSSVGEMLLGIGLSRVNEFLLGEQFKRTSSKIEQGASDLIHRWESLRSDLNEAVKSNAPYKLETKYECQRCKFKSDSLNVLEAHLESPHRDNSRASYICNWCNVRTKDPAQMVYHNHLVHKRRCQVEKPISAHCCRYCPFESKAKRKFTAHFTKCEQSFQPNRVQVYNEELGVEFPAITSKFITREDVRTYESTLKALRLAAYNPHQIKVSTSNQVGQPVLVLSRKMVPYNHNVTSCSTTNTSTNLLNASSPFNKTPMAFIGRGFGLTSIDKTDTNTGSHRDSVQLLNFLTAQTASKTDLHKRPSVIKHPKSQSQYVNGLCVIKAAQNIVMPPQNQNGDSGHQIEPTTNPHSSSSSSSSGDQLTRPKPSNTFISCEMCYSDLDNFNQFKNHMQWVHKVKIHQKMSERPPLMCQKCHWRFYTDHGLERHLLGVHSLVTPNLRDEASKDTDSGRCTVCGSNFAKNLVGHMRDFHKANLKPAQLSYRCTVCSATFSLYRLFENHVLKLHSQEKKKTPSATKSSSSTGRPSAARA